MGLPPPTLITVSMLESSETKAVASSSCSIGACSPILENVPAWRGPSNVSRSLIKGVLVEREVPVMMKAFEVSDGREERRCFSTLPVP